MPKENIPLWKKYSLTINEAAEYFNIGISRLNSIAKDPLCPFVLHIGSKKLIKRKQFEDFFRNNKHPIKRIRWIKEASCDIIF